MKQKKSVLIVGIDPILIDFSKSRFRSEIAGRILKP